MQRRDFTKLLGGLAGTGLAGTASADTDGLDPSLQDDPLDRIEIKTTEYNESHIYVGEDPEDTDEGDLYALGYGNGYVQARDRLFQIDIIRHIGYGNSAELLGPAQLPSDLDVRRDLYSPEEIRRQWESASRTIRKVIRGYADGVNRRMTEMAAQGDLPAEFAALGHAPEPWKPEDTVACINYLIGFFGVGGGGELGNAKTLAKLKESLGNEQDAFAAYGDLNWLQSTEDHFTSIPGDDMDAEEFAPELIEQVPDYDDVPDEQLDLVNAALGAETWGIETDIDLPEDITMGRREGQGAMSGFKWGSNAFVIDGDLTETGTPMLGGGPQMGMFKPPIPYEVGLHGAGVDMTGMGVPGAPAEVIGRTDNLAWTVTSGRDDQVDTIAVELDPDDRHRYKWEGVWYEMETETVVHRASPVTPATGGEADTRIVEQEVARIEQDGDTMPVVAWNEEENIAWCQRITTRFDELPGAFIWADLARTDSLAEFEEGLEEFPFTFNFHVASANEDEADIAYFHTGKIPERSGQYDRRLPATPDRHAWNGIRVGTGLGTFDSDPSRGYYVNWNNGPAKNWPSSDGEQNWGSRHRVEALDYFIREKLDVPENVPDGRPVKRAASESISVADVRDIEYQAAKHDSTAQVSAPYLADAARDADDLQDVAAALDEWIATYCRWDGGSEDGLEATEMTYPGHTIFDRARKKLQDAVFDDELDGRQGDLALEPTISRHASDHGNANSDVTFIDALAGETTHDWFADVSGDAGLQSPDPATRDAVLCEVLRGVKSALVEEYGSDPSSWTDQGHTTKFLSLGLSNATEIHIQSRSTYNQAIDVGKFNSDDPAIWQANCQDVVPPSNSGQVNAAEGAQVITQGEEPDRLNDQLEIYAANGEYKPHPHTRTQVEEVAVETRTIRATPEHQFTPVVPAAPRPLPTPISIPDADTSGSDSSIADDAGSTAGEATDTTTDRPTGHTTGGAGDLR
jgi:penicillin amidase